MTKFLAGQTVSFSGLNIVIEEVKGSNVRSSGRCIPTSDLVEVPKKSKVKTNWQYTGEANLLKELESWES